MRAPWAALLREPLVHFAVAGAAIFALYAARDDAGPQLAHEVRIGESDVAWLEGTWSRRWNREPTPEELRGLVGELLREQLLAREARELGLDADDTIVRRRLAQKLEFLIRNTASLEEPSEADLRRLYDATPELFRSEARVSLRHVFFSRERRADPEADARRALARLRGAGPGPGAVPPEMGDPLSIEPELRDAGEGTVENLFGPAFAHGVMALEPGVWAGPVESAYGVHLVFVSHRQPEAMRPFEEVRERLVARWREQREREANAAYFAGLLRKYDVVLDESVERRIGPLDALAGSDG